jgi:hypothetical protein
MLFKGSSSNVEVRDVDTTANYENGNEGGVKHT